MPVSTMEMIVGAVGTLGTGAIGTGVHWFATKVVENSATSQEILAEIRSIKQSIYGNPEIKGPDGLIATVGATAEAVDQLSERVKELDGRVLIVERGCIAIHGELIVRPQG